MCQRSASDSSVPIHNSIILARKTVPRDIDIAEAGHLMIMPAFKIEIKRERPRPYESPTIDVRYSPSGLPDQLPDRLLERR